MTNLLHLLRRRVSARRVLSGLVLLGVSTLAMPLAAQSHSQIAQFGITWTFDRSYPAGQFANGDWWVVGPVRIVKIDPAPTSSGRIKNGSMINPDPSGARQGYDSTMANVSYVASLNVARNVSSATPLVVQPNSSLVSTISEAQAAVRPQMNTCAILTVLNSPAPAGAFRPAYCGTDKSIRFNKGQLDYSKLLGLKPTASTPSISETERSFERPWLDHVGGWVGRFCHPKANMPDYGRDLSSVIGVGALVLHLDYAQSRKELLMVRYVQLGIDLYGIAMNGGTSNWVGNGGHASGRKWPILFAGIVLDDPGMKDIGKQNVAFGEDQQTFYVRETSPGVYNGGHGGYKATHVGMPEWGIKHVLNPKEDNVSWTNPPYRKCCTANAWIGFVLAARLMGAESLWNHDVLFEYMDKYVAEGKRQNFPMWEMAWEPWCMEMWNAYRSHQPPQPSTVPTGLDKRVRAASNFAQPTGMHPTGTKFMEVKITWSVSSAVGKPASFKIYRGASTASLSLHQVGIETETFIDAALPANGTYWYAVSAVDSNGKESARSNAMEVKT